jgi:hypothetical protein
MPFKISSEIITLPSNLKLIEQWIGHNYIEVSLLTKASRDGFKQEVFLQRCC